MGPLGKIFLYLVLVVVCGTMAAPQAWELLRHLPPEWLGGLVAKVQGMPFHRYVSRSLQVSAILLLWPLLRSLRIRSLREFGLTPSVAPVREFMTGLLAGLFAMTLLATVQLLAGTNLLDPAWQSDLRHAVPRIVLSAFVVALIEEFLFRGVILGFLRQFLASVPAVIISSLIFAALHFASLPVTDPVLGDAPRWWSGLEMIREGLAGFGTGPLFGHAFLILFTAGLILGWLTVRTGSLHAAIGLHAAWIFGQQTFNATALYFVNPPCGLLPFLGPSQCKGMVPTGLLPLVCLMLAGALAMVLLRLRCWPGRSVARGC